MKIWNYIYRLGKNNHSSSNNNIAEKLEALNQIRVNGNPNHIREILPCLKNNNSKIRKLAIVVVIYLFNKIPSGQAYQYLKYSPMKIDDFNFYLSNFSLEENLILLSIATHNHNGYIREQAIDELEKLEGSKFTFESLLYRLSDWVEINRIKALKIIRNLKQKENLAYFIEKIEVIENLKKVNRINLSEIYNELIHFIIKENRIEVLQSFNIYSEKRRILLAKLIVTSESNLNELKIFLNDKNFLVRTLVLKRFDLLTENEINKLLLDKSSKVRLETLYKLEETMDITDIASSFVADTSASIRNFSRFILKDKNINFKTLYYQNLIDQFKIEGSLHGLRETNGREYLIDILPYLDSEYVKIKKAAFYVIQEFEPNLAYEFALKNMDCQLVGIRNLAIEYLSKNPTTEAVEKAKKLFQSEDIELKKLSLNFFSKIGKYKALNEILIGTINEDMEIRVLSISYLKEWIYKSNKYFTSPTNIEIDVIRKSIQKVKNTLEEKDYFDRKILKEIEFQFR